MLLLTHFVLLKASCALPEEVQELKVKTNEKFVLDKNFTSSIDFEITENCPEEFNGDSSIELLTFSARGDHLNELNQNIFGHLTTLERNNISCVYLPDHYIRKIDSDTFPPNLEVLNLSNNSIENVDFLRNLKKLTRLYLYSNKILNIQINTFNENLQVLDLKNNSLKKLNFLKNLTGLEKVDLSFNKIEDLPFNFLENSTLLLQLYLSNNFIKFIRSGTFREMKSLKILDLSCNHIEFIGEIFHAFKSTNIHLNNNSLTHISLENENLTLFIDNNPWSCTYLQELTANVVFNYTFNNSTSNINGIKCTNSSIPLDAHKNRTNIANNTEHIITNMGILIGSILTLIVLLIIINIYDYKKFKDKPDDITLDEAGYITPRRRSNHYEETSLNDTVICENDFYVSSEQRQIVI